MKPSCLATNKIKQQKLKTFETLDSVIIKVNKDKIVSVKVERDLFRRVVVALESGREVDVHTLLEGEISSFQFLIAVVDGKLRNCTSKADLSHMLQEHTMQTRPTNMDDTCTIIDEKTFIQAFGKSTTLGK